MPHYDYVTKNGKFYENRYTACFAEMWKTIDQVDSISIYVFPFGRKYFGTNTLGHPVTYSLGYQPCGSILEEYNIKEMLGIEKYARALAFLPGTSFLSEYEYLQKPIADGQMSEFRLDEIEEYISPLMKQLWINGVRYCWEKNYQDASLFIMHYYKPEMTKLERFNLFLLAHYAIDDKNPLHMTLIKNQLPFTQKKYENLLKKATDPIKGTQCMTNPPRINPETGEILGTRISSLVKNTVSHIKRKNEVPTLEQLYHVWEHDKFLIK